MAPEKIASQWGGDGAGSAASVVITEDLLQPKVLKTRYREIKTGVANPLRLRPEIDFWLCKRECKGWMTRKVFVLREDALPDRPIYRVVYYVDFADQNDAFWFRMTWT